MHIHKAGLLTLALLAAAGATPAAVIDFDDNLLAPNSFFEPRANVTWTSGGASFSQSWNETFDCCWGGFTYSNSTDTTTAGFANDRSAITGDGFGPGQDNYGVATVGSGAPELRFAQDQTVLGGYFTNVTYSYLAMLNGDDGNAVPFVKAPFGPGDFFELSIIGLDANGVATGSVEFLLADGADIVDDWAFVDLTSLGPVRGLRFALDSSDAGTFGINTPGYFAVDNISIVPLPAAAWLFISALGLLGLGRRRSSGLMR
ncbi:MAG: DUF4465 domain-containing protein [Gammaproteobacteria bacterium]|nr:DUF4465 domain-containing protein [Gammaproteobacteria bacterium]